MDDENRHTSERQGRRRQRWADTAIWVGTGVVVGMIVLAVLAPRFVGGDDPGFSWYLALATAVFMLGAALRSGTIEPPIVVDRDRGLTDAVTLATGVLLFITVFTFPNGSFYFLPERGWSTGADEAIRWVGVAALTGVGVFVGVLGRAPRGRTWKVRTLSAASGVLATILLGALTGYASLYQPTEHTIAAEGEYPEVPREVSRVGWSWIPPEDTEVQRIAAGPRGPIVFLEDGVVALEGTSGKELWTFRRPYDGTLLAFALQGGEQVRALWRPTRGMPDSDLQTVFDAATGRVLWEGPIPVRDREKEGDPRRDDHWWYTPEVEVFVGHHDEQEGHLLQVWASNTGEELWSLPPSPESGPNTRADCFQVPERVAATVVDGSIVVPRICGDEEATYAVTAMDALTGDELWHWEEHADDFDPEFPNPPRVRAGRGLVTEGEGPVIVIGDLFSTVTILDARTGEEAIASPQDPEDEQRYDSALYLESLHEDTGGSVHLHQVAQQGRGGTNRYELHRADASGEITDKVTVGHHERELFYDHRNSVALGRTSVLIPHTAREEQGEDGPLEFSVLSVPLDGDGEDAVWIEVARYEEFEHSSSAEHSLLPVPGAVISYSEATEVNTIHGLVP